MGAQPHVGPLEPVYTVAEIAKALRISRVSVHRLIVSGAIDAFRTGRPYRIRESALNAYLNRIGYTAAPAVT